MHPIAQRCDNSPPKWGFSLFKNTGIAVPEWALTISRLVNWLADKEGATLEQKRHHFTEAVIRMNSIYVGDKVAAYQRNLKELDSFMASPAMKGDAFKFLLNNYKQARNTLSNKAYELATSILGDSGKDYPKVERKGWSLFK